MTRPLAIIAPFLAAACAQTAGDHIVRPEFGQATATAHAVQTGAIGAAQALGARFQSLVPTTINFPFDSTVLTPQARAVLDAQADFMRAFPEARFSVFGHTDLVGSDAYNRDLGLRRARAAVAYLAARGVSLSRLDALVSRGEQDPLIAVAGPVEANRRTVTRVSGFVADNPLVLDGRYARIIYREYVASSGRFPSATSQTEGQLGTAGGGIGTSDSPSGQAE